MLHTILIVFAFVCAVIATFNVPSKVNLGAAALAFYFASMLFTGR